MHHTSRHDDFGVHNKVQDVLGIYHRTNSKVLINEAGKIIIDIEMQKEAQQTHPKKFS